VAERSFLSHAKVISALTLISRILGMLRESALMAFFGTGVVASAFTVAWTIPNLFRRLLGEGAISATFIPLYSEALKSGNLDEARRFASASVNLVAFILLVITLLGETALILGIIFADPQRMDTIIILRLSAIMLPYLVLICLTAFLSAILQVHHYFALPAATPIVLNLIHIGVTISGGWLLGITLGANPDELLDKQNALANYRAIGVLFAGAAQIAVLIPALRRIGFRFSLRESIWTPAVRRMLKLSIPLAIAAGVLQISILIDKGIAVFLAQSIDLYGNPITYFRFLGHEIAYPMELGAVRRLDVAQVLYQFPLGIFAIAIATAIFPRLSSSALNPDRTEFRKTMRTGMEATLFEGMAASFGLIIVRYQVVRLLFEYGKVTDHDVELIAQSLMIYSTAIWAYSMQQIINRVYYSLQDTRTPLLMAIVNVLLSLAIKLPLLWTPLAESAMAVGTAASFSIQSVIMLLMLKRRGGDFGLREIGLVAFKLLVASLAMLGACQLVGLLPVFDSISKFASLIQLVLLLVAGGVTYLACCHLLRVHIMYDLFKLRKSK